MQRSALVIALCLWTVPTAAQETTEPPPSTATTEEKPAAPVAPPPPAETATPAEAGDKAAAEPAAVEDGEAKKPEPAEAKKPTEEEAEPKVEGPRVISETVAGMGTRLQIMVWAEDEAKAKSAITEAFAELTRVEARLSEWSPKSDVSRINGLAGKGTTKVSTDTLRVLERGKQVSSLSKGAFSLSWAALGSLWDFSPGAEAKLPDPAALRLRLQLVDDAQITLDKAKQTAGLAAPGMALGLAGIGKGYAIDRALETLKARGIANALVFAGGDIGVIGSKGKKPWVIGVQDPRAVGFFAVFSARDEAIATSGDYEAFFELDDKRYHHLLDPRTGLPATGSRSATVVARDAMSADAFATALFVLGPVEGMKLIESQAGIEAMVVDEKNEIILSSGMKDRVRVVRPPTE